MTFKSILLTAAFLPFLVFAGDSSKPEDYTSRFSLEESRDTLEYIADALTSFRKLTEESPQELTEKVGNTGWDIQNLGFNNWVDTLTGTLLLQQYQIAELRYQMLPENTSIEDQKKAESTLAAAKESYSKFTSNLQVMD